MGLFLAFIALTLPQRTLTECGQFVNGGPITKHRHRVPASSSLPWLYSIAGVLQQCEPSAVVEPLDHAGIQRAATPFVSLGASTWTGTFFRFNGLDANDPYQPGRPLLLPAVEDAAIVVAPHAASAGPRAYSGEVSMQVGEVVPDWHFQASSFNTGRPLHAPAPQPSQRFRYFTRDRMAASIPLARKLDLLLSGVGQWAALEEHNSRIFVANAWAAYSLGKAGQLSGGIMATRFDGSGGVLPAGIQALTTRRTSPQLESPSLSQDDNAETLQLAWSRANAQIRYGYTTARLNTNPARMPSAPALPPRVDLLSGEVSGPPLFWNNAVRHRHELAANFRRGGFTGAAGWQTAQATNRPVIPGLTHILTVGGAPRVITRFHPTQESSGTVRAAYAFVQYERRWVSWLNATAGLVADWTTAGPISWISLAPRVGFALRIPGTDRLLFRGTYTRTAQLLAARLVEFADPASLSGEEFLPDGTLLRRFGGRYSSIDPGLDRPIRDEFTVGMETSFPFGAHFRLRLFRSDDKRRIAAVNVGVPVSAYAPVAFLDPGEDFVAGTFDDRTLTVYAQDPATLARDRFLLTTPSGLRMQNNGLLAQAGLNRRHWWALFSFTAEKSIGPTNAGNQAYENDPGVLGNLFTDPNAMVNASGRSFFDRAFIGKAAGAVELPRCLGRTELGGMLNYVDGLVFGRRLLIDGLPQGPFVVFATVRGSPEGGHRTEYYATLDLRISRMVETRAGQLRISADVFNAANASHKLRENDRSGPSFSERLPLLHQPGRMLRLGFAYQF